jgi:hypothetical protein
LHTPEIWKGGDEPPATFSHPVATPRHGLSDLEGDVVKPAEPRRGRVMNERPPDDESRPRQGGHRDLIVTATC